MEKQDKLEPKTLEKYRSFIAGLALPCGEQSGFVSFFGILKGEQSMSLLDEAESPDIIELVEKMQWLKTRFHFRGGTYRQAGDFVFGNGQDMALAELLQSKHIDEVRHSSVLFGHDEQRPFITLLPEIRRKIDDGVIVIDEESLLSLKLKEAVLSTPAAVQYGQSPAMESACFAYYGWQELKRRADEPPQQTQMETEDIFIG